MMDFSSQLTQVIHDLTVCARAEGFAEAAPEVLEAIRLDRRGVPWGFRPGKSQGKCGYHWFRVPAIAVCSLNVSPSCSLQRKYSRYMVPYTFSIWVRIRFGWLQGGRVANQNEWPLVWNCDMRAFSRENDWIFCSPDSATYPTWNPQEESGANSRWVSKLLGHPWMRQPESLLNTGCGCGFFLHIASMIFELLLELFDVNFHWKVSADLPGEPQKSEDFSNGYVGSQAFIFMCIRKASR